MDKWYGFKYYTDLGEFMLKKTKAEHARDIADNIIVVGSEGKLIFSFIVDFLLVTTDSLSYEQAYEAFYFTEKWIKNKKKRIDKERLYRLYNYVTEHNMLGYVYSLLDGKYKSFKEGTDVII